MNYARPLSIAAVIVAITCGAAGHLNAQAPSEPMPFASYPFASLREALFTGIKLTPAQTNQIFASTSGLLDKMRAIGPSMQGATPELKRTKIDELGKQHADELRKLLTDPQKAKFDSNSVAWGRRAKRSYSVRINSAGSTDDARRLGMNAAIPAVSANRQTTDR